MSKSCVFQRYQCKAKDDAFSSAAATAEGGDGGLVTAGGRVLSLTGRGRTIAEARGRAYDAVAELAWSGMQFRRDIAANPTGAGSD